MHVIATFCVNDRQKLFVHKSIRVRNIIKLPITKAFKPPTKCSSHSLFNLPLCSPSRINASLPHATPGMLKRMPVYPVSAKFPPCPCPPLPAVRVLIHDESVKFPVILRLPVALRTVMPVLHTRMARWRYVAGTVLNAPFLNHTPTPTPSTNLPRFCAVVVHLHNPLPPHHPTQQTIFSPLNIFITTLLTLHSTPSVNFIVDGEFSLSKMTLSPPHPLERQRKGATPSQTACESGNHILP